MTKGMITEKEAMDILTKDIHTLEELRDGEMGEMDADIFGEKHLKALTFAVHAIAEAGQYRKIGTVKECRELADIVGRVERDSLASVIDEWLAYRKLGTVEELQAAVGGYTSVADK